jgi:hypothetical protein
MVNLHKSKTKDHNEKWAEIQGWSFSEIKLLKIGSLESIRVAIETN